MTTDEIKRAIDSLYGDTSVSMDTTRDRMEELAEHADTLAKTADEEIRRAQQE